jgi:hypothetical protein
MHPMSEAKVQYRRWTRLEYEQLIERGFFAPDERVELIDGLMLVAEPQTAAHFTTVRLVERALARAFGDGWEIRCSRCDACPRQRPRPRMTGTIAM